MSMVTGTGVANREGSAKARWSLEVGGAAHLPLISRWAVMVAATGKSLVTDEVMLVPAELFRVGGQGSIRGYSDREFAFRSVAFGQLELLMYLGDQTSLYVFGDGGAGFTDKITFHRSDRTVLLGYGVGIRAPTRIGTLSIEWARNAKETRGLGRIHFGFKTPLSAQ